MKKNSDTKLKILSVLLAIFMWTFVINSTNPTVNKTFRNIPVVIKNQDGLEKSGYVIIDNDQTYTTNIKLKGTRERLVGLKPTNIYASIDIANLSEGVQSLEIKVDTPSGISVEELEPEDITLNIQKVIEKNLPVNPVINDKIKDGRIADVNEITPANITVKGPASLINKVDRAEVRIDDMSLLDGKIHNVPIKVLDRSGKVIEDINISHDDINISFIVYETKKVPIKVATTGFIDSNYMEISREVSPDTIVIKGKESLIRDVEEINTKPININRLRGTVSGEVKLDLPEGIEVYNGEGLINYRIEIERKPEKEEKKAIEDDEEWYPQ